VEAAGYALHRFVPAIAGTRYDNVMIMAVDTMEQEGT